MSANIPTSRLLIRPQYYRRDRAILSGEEDVDQIYGIRGLVSQENHAFAYRTRIISELAYPNSAATGFFESTGTSYVPLTAPQVYHPIGEGVITLTAFIDGYGVYYYISTSDGDSAETVITSRAQNSQTYTLSNINGGDYWVQLYVKAKSGYTGKVYRMCIRETVLTGITT